MKKTIIMLLAILMLASVLLSVPAMAMADLDITAYEGLEYTEDGTLYVANEVYVYLDHVIDLEIYKTENPPQFLGVDVVKITCGGARNCPPEKFLAKYGWVIYRVCLDGTLDEQTVVELFSKQDGVVKAKLIIPNFPDAPPINEEVIGDVNLNGKIDSRDYLLLKRAYFGTTKLPCDISVADFNGNGKLDSRDYMLLKRAYFGTYTIGTTPDEA